MNNVLVFDMDDTLYDELTYVRSGFAAVAEMLSPHVGVSSQKLLHDMLLLLARSGRGQVFDDLLIQHQSHTPAMVRRCVTRYRAHDPKIKLWSEAMVCFERYRKLPIYVVTDGHKVAQHAKASALGLYDIARKVLLTNRYGRNNAKPSPYCFQRIATWEKTSPTRIVYIADNPAKDFVGIRPLGFQTVRVLTGQHASVVAKPGCDAEHRIASLAELDLKRVFG